MMESRKFGPFDGAVLVDKPVGMTSHDVVDRVRRRFGIKKAGHAGTLDPNATGLLVILIGSGTKLSARLMGADKHYEGIIRFGTTTDSYDVDGKVVETRPVPELSLGLLNKTAEKFTGDIMQTPPMVSARFARPRPAAVWLALNRRAGAILFRRLSERDSVDAPPNMP